MAGGGPERPPLTGTQPEKEGPPGRREPFERSVFYTSSGEEVRQWGASGRPEAFRLFDRGVRSQFAGREAEITSAAYPASLVYNELETVLQDAVDRRLPDFANLAAIADAFLALTYQTDKFDPEQKLAIARARDNSLKAEVAEVSEMMRHSERPEDIPEAETIDMMRHSIPEVGLHGEQRKTVQWLVGLVGVPYKDRTYGYTPQTEDDPWRQTFVNPYWFTIEAERILAHDASLSSSQTIVDNDELRQRKR